jgi:Tfp pilus assembly protein PilF
MQESLATMLDIDIAMPRYMVRGASMPQRPSTRYWIIVAAACLACAVGCKDEQPNNTSPADAPTHAEIASPPMLAPAEIVALRNRAAGHMGQFDYEPAVVAYEQLLAAQPSSSDARVDLAIALINRRMAKDPDRAAELLDRVIRDDATNLRARYCRGLLAYHNAEIGKAREQFAEVVRRDPKDAYAMYFLGQCLLTEGRFSEALREFQRAQQVDPYLRSAYYGAFQAAQRAGDQALAGESLAMFQRLAENPRARAAELKYTRMGPKAEVDVQRETGRMAVNRPDGPVLAAAIELPIAGPNDATFRGAADPSRAPHVTVADINGDGHSDLFLARAIETPGGDGNAVLLQDGASYRVETTHPLASIVDVNATLWGDYDNDGLVDVYLCRSGPNQLWRQTSPGEWVDVTALAHASGGNFTTVDGACFDADHDGDLDYFLVNSDGPNDLLNNDRNGTFRSIGESQGLSGRGQGSRRVVVADIDSDDDADLVIVNQSPPHEVYINDRLWEYRRGLELADFCSLPIDALVAVDSDVDGQSELYAVGIGQVVRWVRSEDGSWSSERIADLRLVENGDAVELAVRDFDGDTQLDILLQQGAELRLLALDGTLQQEMMIPGLAGCVGVLVTDRGPELIACRRDGMPLKLPSGKGRFPFTRLQLRGRIDKGAEMRSNASGIGVSAWARIGERWAVIPPFRTESGPGQSLQPAAVGLGGSEKIDFLRLVWPDGVSQSELNLSTRQLHTIGEIQRQVGSCPVVFVWNGERFEFVADILGAGGLGINLGKGEYYQPRPEENLLLPSAKLQPQGGHFIVKLCEPMEEVCYLDAVRLVSYDLPAGWHIALDERLGGSFPMPTGEAIFYRDEILSQRALNGRGEDVTATILKADKVAAPLHRVDRRFVGLAEPHQLIVEFAEPIDQLKSPFLLFDGWVEYAYSQTAFAAWQSETEFLLPTIEARGKDGRWHVIAEHFGYMAGSSRRSAVPLDRSRLPLDARELRISTNLQIYWDCISIVDGEPCPSARRNTLEMAYAEVAEVGFARRKVQDQRCASYDYAERPPLADARHPKGWYTAFGDARKLIAGADNALAIIGPGEELHLEFVAHDPCPTGFERSFVLEANGWCKDADLFTKNSGAVEPLPTRADLATPENDALRFQLHRAFHTRFMSGW